MSLDLSIVVPVYRSAATLHELVQRVARVAADLQIDYEVILVDDGSPDASWQVIRNLHRQDPEHIVAIQLMRNYGQHNALMCGLRRSRGRYIATLDDDLQNPPEELARLYRHLRASELDLVYGSAADKKHGAWRNLGSWVVNCFYRATFGTRVTATSFRIFTRPLAESIFPYVSTFTFIDGLLAWNTQRIGELPVEHHPRRIGRSGYSLGRLVLLSLNLFTNFSLLPLQAISLTGLVVSGAGVLAGFSFLSLYWLTGVEAPGSCAVIVAVLTLAGLQMLGLGVVGEYIGRVHLNINHKPQYTERQYLERVERSVDLQERVA
jgi:undecaprenyl-phosphate 4-deoxy-4-formamido-L-arabinose transferase